MKQWAIITGAGTGIGAALARTLANENLQVLAVGRRLEKLQETQKGLEDKVHPLALDIADVASPDKINDAIPASDQILYLVQNAAVGVPAKLDSMKREDFEYAMAVNVTAPLFLTQKLLPRMKTTRGRVLHLGTGVAFAPQLGTISYVLSKNAFYRLYEHLKVELAGTGVLVGSARPGIVDTEGLWEHIKLAKGQQLPHTEYFDRAEKDGHILSSEHAAKFLSFLLRETGDEEYQEKEWGIHDEEHRPRWMQV